MSHDTQWAEEYYGLKIDQFRCACESWGSSKETIVHRLNTGMVKIMYRYISSGKIHTIKTIPYSQYLKDIAKYQGILTAF